jgi:hypothetical protein
MLRPSGLRQPFCWEKQFQPNVDVDLASKIHLELVDLSLPTLIVEFLLSKCCAIQSISGKVDSVS